MMTLLCAVFSSAWADDAFYTLAPAKGSNNSYAGNCDITINGIIWNLTGNSQMQPWRLGGKSLSNVDREVYSKTEMGADITHVDLTVGGASDITVNSLKLTVASDAGFSNVLDEVSVTFAANSTITFEPSDGASWDMGAFYKFTFNVTVSGTSNKFVEFSKAEFFGNSETPAVPTPTFDPEPGTFFKKDIGNNFGVSIECEDESATIYYTTDGSTPNKESAQFTGNVITVRETTTIKAIAIDSEGNMSNIATGIYTISDQDPLANLGELTIDEEGNYFEREAGNYFIVLEDAKVTYTNGNYAYIEDNYGAIVLYKSGHGLTAGQTINGLAEVTFQLRNSNPQITEIKLSNCDSEIIEEPEPFEIAANSWEAVFNSTLNQYYKVTGAKITQTNGKYYITLGGENVQLYGQGDARTIQVGDLRDTYTIVGFPTLFNSTKELQIFVQPVAEGTVEPLKEPGLAFAEDRVIAYLSEGAEMPALSNEYGVEVTYSSSNTDVATIDSEGSITLVGTGSTVITASYEEDDEYYASSATFTLIVKNKVEYAEGELFHETFDAFEGTGGRDGRFKANQNESNFAAAKFDIALTDEVWSFASDAKIYGANKSARLGASSADGTITTRTIELTGDGTLTFSAAGWDDTASNKLTVSAEGAGIAFESGGPEITLTNGEWVNYIAAISDAQGEITITFTGKRGFIDDIIVTNEKTTFPEEATIAFDLENDQINVNYVEGEDFEEPTLINEKGVEPIYYSSSKEEVATVDEETGEVTLTGGEGTAVITATFNGNDNYSAATASYTIIVTVPAQPTGDVFELVTTNNLAAGDQIIIVNVNEGSDTETSFTYMGLGEQRDNNRAAVEVEANEDGTLNGNDDLSIITLESATADNTWRLYDGKGYLYSAGGGNYLRTKDEPDADGKADAAITISDDGTATIVFQDKNTTRNTLRYNSSNNPPIFSCYLENNNMKDVKIYRKKVVVEGIPGDANNDGIVNVTDVMLVVRYSGGMEVLDINLKNADINDDGQVNITDAMSIIPLAVN